MALAAGPAPQLLWRLLPLTFWTWLTLRTLIGEAAHNEIESSGRQLPLNASGTMGETSCSCYHIQNDFCCQAGQVLCACSNICYNGDQFVKLGEKCEDALPLKNSPLFPIRCEDGKGRSFKAAMTTLQKENRGLKFVRKPLNWLKRAESFAWKEGVSALFFLDDSENNIAHFIRKVNHLLLFSSSRPTPLGYPDRVDRVLLKRSPGFLKAAKGYGPGGFHAQLLKHLVGMTFKMKSSQEEVDANLFLEENPAAHENLHFEDALESASEKHPLCFRSAVFTGNMKASAYPAGPIMADVLTRRLAASLKVTKKRLGFQSNVLYIQRKASGGKKRELTPESEEKFLKLLEDVSPVLKVLDFGKLSFQEQFQEVQRADVIVGLHGAGLVNAAAFARRHAVVLEIQPYKVEHIIFEGMTLSSGALYMVHQCHKGKSVEGDDEFNHYRRQHCRHELKCREYYVQHRPVELTPKDLSSLKRMLEFAIKYVWGSRHSLHEANEWLVDHYGTECVENSGDLDNVCRLSFIHSPTVDPKNRCILEKDDC